MMDWDKTRNTFRTLFADQSTAEMINIQVPVAEMDWDYTVTLENDDSLQIVIKGDCFRESDKTTWIYFGAYEARELAAILLGFADASDARKERESR